MAPEDTNPEDTKVVHNREVQKLYFEFFKHFTTVATAAALVEITLYQQFQLESVAAIVGVSMLGLTLLASIVGMLIVPTQAGVQGAFRQGRTHFLVLMPGIALIFFVGIGTFTVVAINPEPSRVLDTALSLGAPVAGVIGGIALHRVLRRYVRRLRKYKELSYVVTSTQLLQPSEEIKDKIDVRYEGVHVSNLEAVAVTIFNTGTEYVSLQDLSIIEEPITIDFGEAAQVLGEPQVKSDPEGKSCRLWKDPTRNRIVLDSFLLDPGDSLTVYTTLTNFFEESPTISWRLVNVHEPRRLKVTAEQD